MEKPEIADTKPMFTEVEAGNYYWCSCGKSSSQPFCDGSHKGSSFSPLKITVEEKKKLAFCMCKQSKNGAFCDGSHASV